MIKILQGDALTMLRTLPTESVQCCVTSPPYWGLRDYGAEGQLGLEKTPEEYVFQMVEIFREVRRVLRKDGTLWLNLGDSYASNWPCNRRNIIGEGSLPNGKRDARPSRLGGLKEKDLVGIPWRVAFALQADGWWLRSDIIWAKPNPMPESVTDRPTKSHEYIFLLTKSSSYFYDAEAIKEPSIYFDDDRKGRASEDHKRMPNGSVNGIRPTIYKDARSYDGKHTDKQRGHGRLHAGFNDRWDHMEKTWQCSSLRNKRSVWTIATAPYPEAHFATYPPDLIKPCIMAGTKTGDAVLDPFAGSGTTGAVATELGRKAILIELNPKYVELIERRTSITPGLALA